MNTWYVHPKSLLYPVSDLGFTRAMTRNEAKYANPERFQPERFLRENGELVDDTMGYIFGAGRRICVGRRVADASLWSAIVSILAVFRIAPCKDEQGNDIQVDPRWTAGITSCVTPRLRKAFGVAAQAHSSFSFFFWPGTRSTFPARLYRGLLVG